MGKEARKKEGKGNGVKGRKGGATWKETSFLKLPFYNCLATCREVSVSHWSY